MSSVKRAPALQELSRDHLVALLVAKRLRSAEDRDAATQLSMYGSSAVVTIVDKISQPGSPRVLGNREEIRAWLEDMYARDMTHTVKHRVLDDSGAAYTQACRYADGTNVLCATVIELDGGVISGQTVLEVWDEA